MQSYLPHVLPTIEEAHAHHERITADHAAILATIPCPENKAKLQQIEIVSWNVLENDGGNGFAKNGEHMYGENTPQNKSRHTGIVNTLVKFNKNNNPDFITLQEIYVKGDAHSLCSLVGRALAPEYEVARDAKGSIIDYPDCITFYRTNKFKPITEMGADHKYGDALANITKFTAIGDDDFEIRLANCHHSFYQNTLIHQKNIERFLDGEGKATPSVNAAKTTLSIIVGDFNGTIAQLNKPKRNITTSVAPAKFAMDRKDPDTLKAVSEGLQAQKGWAIDGCFYSARQPNQTEAIGHKQASSVQLNPDTGFPLDNNDLAPLSTDQLTEFQRKMVEKYQLAICVDDSCKNIKTNNMEHTISEYEALLQNNFSDNRIAIRLATNLNNEHGIGIMLNKPLYIYLRLMNRKFDCELEMIDETGEVDFVAYANNDNAHHLINSLMPQNLYTDSNENLRVFKTLVGFAEAINSLEVSKKTKDNKKIIASVPQFKLLFQDIQQNPNKHTSPILIEEFTQLANDFITKGDMTHDEIDAFAKRLEQRLEEVKLEGKPQMSERTNTIVCGLIGALVGAILGVAIGAVMTGYVGGVGAIPGLMFGAAKGFTIGSAIALGATGGIGGGAFGFFSAREDQKQYDRHLKAIENIDPVIQKGKGIYTKMRAG